MVQLRLFISHASTDRPVAHLLAETLGRYGAQVACYEEAPGQGETLVQQVGEEIMGAHVVLLLLSPAGVKAQRVRQEVAWALSQGRQVLPVRLEESSLHDFLFLADWPAEDLTFMHVPIENDAAMFEVEMALDAALYRLASDLRLPNLGADVAVELPDELQAGPQEDFDTGTPFSEEEAEFLQAAAAGQTGPRAELSVFIYRTLAESNPELWPALESQITALSGQWLAEWRARLTAQGWIALRRGHPLRARRRGEDTLQLAPGDRQGQQIIQTTEQISQPAAIVRQHPPPVEDELPPGLMLSQVLLEYDLAGRLGLVQVLGEAEGRLNGVAISPDSRLLAAGGADRLVHVWEWEAAGRKLSHVRSLEHDAWVSGMAFSPRGNLLVATIEDVLLWRLPNFQNFRTMHSTRQIDRLSLSTDGRLLAIGTSDNNVSFWKMPAGDQMNTLSGYSNRMSAISLTRDNRALATGCLDGLVQVWEWRTRTLIMTALEHTGNVNALVESPAGRWLATGSVDKTIRLWDIGGAMPSGECVAVLEGHDKWVSALAFSPDGRVLASGSGDNTVRLWDVRGERPAGHCLATLEGHRGWVSALAFSPDGRWLVSGGDDKQVIVWGLVS
jgi:hypothetical protein